MLNAPFRFLTLFIVVIVGLGWMAMGNVEFLQPTATRLRAQEEQMEIDARRAEISATHVAMNRAQQQEAARHELQMDEAEKQSALRVEAEAERQLLWLWGEEILLYILMGFAALMGVVLPATLLYTGIRWANIAFPTSRPTRRPRVTPSTTLPASPTTRHASFIAAPRPNDTIQWAPVKIRPRRRERNYHS